MTEIVKKVIVRKSDLPPTASISGSYKVRYRIVSDDLNRTSAWSPIYTLSITPISNTVEYDIQVSTNTITTIWNSIPDIPLSTFDVYIRWIGDPVGEEDPETTYPWTYTTSIGTTSYSIIKPSSVSTSNGPVIPTHFQISVQVPSYKKEKDSAASLFTSEIVAL